MTVEANSTPVSIDYTSRDYYAIRQALIERVKDRTNGNWQGTDPNDFGLALIESFAYMGDMINYYIDRLTNESYILTATQRETLLNIAKMYGYTPAGYVSAATTITMSNNNGYRGLIGAAIVEDGVVDGNTITNVSKLIVPNDHPFAAIASTTKYNVVKVAGVPQTATASNVLGGKSLTYTTSIYNGTFPVLSTGYNNIGTNVVWFKPESTISGVTVSGTTMTVTTSTTADSQSLVPLQYQKVTIRGVTKSGDTGSNATSSLNGNWVVTTDSSGNSFTIDASTNTATISKVVGLGTSAVYSVSSPRISTDTNMPTVWNDFVVNQKVSITGLSDAAFNVSNGTVSAVTNTVGIITSAISYATIPNTIQYMSSVPVTIGQIVTISDVQSVLNQTAESGSNFNLTDIKVDTVPTAPTAIITNVTPNATTGLITFEVAGGLNSTYFTQYQYVTISGVVNNVAVSGDPTDVYNMSGVRIESVTSTSFTVRGSWTETVNMGLSTSAKATVYVFTVKASNVADLQTSQGSIYIKTFTVSGLTGATNKTASISAVNPTFAPTAASISGTTVTYTCANKLSVGDSITISGITGGTNATAFNLSGTVATCSGTQFTVTVPTTFTASGGVYSAAVVTVTNSAYTTYVGTNAFTVGNLVTLSGFTANGADNVVNKTIAVATSTYFKIAGYTTPGAFSSASALSYPTNGTAVAVITADRTGGGTLDYAPIPAVVTGGYVYNVGATTVPKGTQVTGQISSNGSTKSIIFTTLSDNIIDFKTDADVAALHGEDVSKRTENLKNTALKAYDIDGELLGTSTGLADQSFTLSETVVHTSFTAGITSGTGDIRIFVDNGTVFEEWQRVAYTMDYSSYDKVFSVSVDANDKVVISFGDGISGAIPPMSMPIKAQYIAGGGSEGNIVAGTLVNWGNIPLGEPDASAIRNNITPVNAVDATGGVDPESNDSIRYNAPRAMRSLNRAVTLQDYSDLALSVGGVAKANAVAANSASVTVYISPTSPDSSTDVTPGFYGDSITDTMKTLKTTVKQFLDDRKQIGTSVYVYEPYYTALSISILYSPAPQYSTSVVEDNIKKALIYGFGYNYVNFADVLTPEEVEFKLRQVDGVVNVKVISLFRPYGSGRNSLVGSDNEIFYFDQNSIVLDSASTIATLDNLVVTAAGGSGSTVSLTPSVWNVGKFNYTGTLPSGTTSITVTPTGTPDPSSVVTSVISVNGAVVASGVASSSILANAGSQNTVLVTVTAQDGVTVNTYKLSLS